MTRNRLRSEKCFLKKFEPNTVSEALQDDDWYNAKKEEIEKMEKKKTCTLVPRLEDKNAIGTKWVFKKKLDENGEIIRNKARLVYKGYVQEEGLYYGKKICPYCKNGRNNDLPCICYL